MSNASGYSIHPSFQRQQSEQDGLVYQATYVIEDDKGMQGEPVVVGTFASAEEAMTAAQEAGAKVLAQLH